jgi:hypothetical protein
MSLKSKMNMFLGLFALSSAGLDALHGEGLRKKRIKKFHELTEAEATELRDKHEQLRRKRYGMKEFFFHDGGSVWARNLINAQRKAFNANLGYKPLGSKAVDDGIYANDAA